MRNRVIVLATTLLAIGLCSPCAHAQRKKSIFEKAAELIGKAARPAAPARPVPRVNPPNPANDRIKGERRERVLAHLNSMVDWVDHVCSLSAEQKKQIEELVKTQVTRSQENWLKAPNRGAQNGNRDFIPYEFIGVIRSVTHTSRAKKELGKILTEQQNDKLQKAREERDASLKKGLVGLALLVLDQELFLTPDAREPVAEQLMSMFGSRLYPGLYAFGNNSWPFQRAQFSRRTKLKKVLGDVRYKRYERLTKNNGQAEQYVMITMGSGDGQSSFNKAVEAQPERINEAMAIRIAWLKEMENLSDKDARRLAIAAKGAASREIDKWVEQSEKQMQRMREQFANQNVSWGMSQMQIAVVERNSLWTKTRDRVLGKESGDSAKVKKETPEDRVKSIMKSAIADLLNTKKAEPKEETVVRNEREQFQRDKIVDYVVAILDQEVWLRADQRSAMRLLMDKTLGDFKSYTRYSNQYTELQLLGDAVHTPADKEVKQLLDERQYAAWSQLKKQFQLQENNNMFKMSYRHGDVQFPFVAGRNRRRNR